MSGIKLLIMLLPSFAQAGDQPAWWPEVEKSFLLSKPWCVELQVRALSFVNDENIRQPTSEKYLTCQGDDGYPNIYARIEGHHFSFDLLPIGDGKEILAVTYSAGGNQTITEFFCLDWELLPSNVKPVASNMADIKLIPVDDAWVVKAKNQKVAEGDTGESEVQVFEETIELNGDCCNWRDSF